MEYKITLTEAEQKALSYVAVSPLEWIENAVKERCRLAIDEIFQLEVERMVKDPTVTEIPADKNSVVLAANIKSAQERAQDIESAFMES